jgi:hypothetical protein
MTRAAAILGVVLGLLASSERSVRVACVSGDNGDGEDPADDPT